MTYNFDPERWRDDRVAKLQLDLKSGRISQPEFDEAVAETERRYERMMERLDSTYDLPVGKKHLRG